ncbi:hypothetical protein Amal_04020 [Acetobacter malorum]|uniref:Uncharacterized protein n=1 Tax=Acetobacter malorum TaxID=178901 RepID=A0A177FZA4_9PROT|nr:hypothetical protein Amal_04020 [Acetobacter malorum]
MAQNAECAVHISQGKQGKGRLHLLVKAIERNALQQHDAHGDEIKPFS